jgi:SNF2 family DNA or RNA helicase
VVADESTRLKNFRTRQGGVRAKALGKVAHTKIKFFNQLTGTPAPNGLIDLWGQMWMLDGGQRLGRSYTAFVERWFRPAYNGGAPVPFAHTAEEITHALSDVCLSLRPEDWFDLRAPIIVNRYVELPIKARMKYDEMEKTFYMELDKHPVEAANSAVRTQKLLQVANGACYVDPLVISDDDPKSKEWKEVHDVKLQELESIANEFSGAQLLVVYNFRSDMERLVKAFPKGRLIDKKNPNATEKDWNEGKIPMLFVHPKSAGHGLNLQMGGYVVVFFGHNWNLEERLQVIERVGPVRQMQSGFERNVYIINIVAQDTVDELVMARVDTKKSVQDLILEARSTKRGL